LELEKQKEEEVKEEAGKKRKEKNKKKKQKKGKTIEVKKMDKGVWEEAVRKDANKKGVGPHDRCEGGVCTMKRKGIPIVKRREREGKRICERAVAEGIYPAVEVTTNGASIFCGEER